MGSSVEFERIDFGEQRLEEIITNARFLPLLEAMSIYRVVLSSAEYPDRHRTRFRIRSLALAHGMKCDSPC